MEHKPTDDADVKVVHYSAETVGKLKLLFLQLLEDYVYSEIGNLEQEHSGHMADVFAHQDFEDLKVSESYYRRKFTQVTGIDITTPLDYREPNDTGAA